MIHFLQSIYYILPLKPKYLPQHPTLKHPHLMSLPEYIRLSKFPTNKKSEFHFGQQTESSSLTLFIPWKHVKHMRLLNLKRQLESCTAYLDIASRNHNNSLSTNGSKTLM
jgi:hypothetical protein